MLHPLMKLILLSLAILFLPFQLFAERKFSSVSAGVQVVAGDNVCTNPEGSTDPSACLSTFHCGTADVDGGGAIGEGVRAVSNTFYLQLTNISNISQTISAVDFEVNDIGYSVSKTPSGSRYKQGYPNLEIAVPNKPKATFNTFKLAPGESKSISYAVFCLNGYNCEGKFVDNSPAFKNYLANLQLASSILGFTCQQMYSTIKITINVRENRGALQGILAAISGRVAGQRDKSNNLHIPLNGGRPF